VVFNIAVIHRAEEQPFKYIFLKGGSNENEAYWGDYFFSDFPFVSIGISLGSIGSSDQSQCNSHIKQPDQFNMD